MSNDFCLHVYMKPRGKHVLLNTMVKKYRQQITNIMKIAPVSELPCLANTFRRFILRNLCNNGRQRTEAAILILLMWEQDKFYPNIYWFPSGDNKGRVEK